MKLLFIPRTNFEANQFLQAIEKSPFHGEWNSVEGYFSFEEQEEMIDELEYQLNKILEQEDINGHFESE